MTAAVLEVNADCYTFWNYRREIIEAMKADRTEEEMKLVFSKELTWLESTLALWPKSYWVWFHRRWVSSLYSMDWKRELELCLKLHKIDSRNCTWNACILANALCQQSLPSPASLAHCDSNHMC